MSMSNEEILNALKLESIHADKVKVGDIMVYGDHDVLIEVARIEVAENGAISIFDEDDNGATGYRPHWEMKIIPRRFLRKPLKVRAKEIQERMARIKARTSSVNARAIAVGESAEMEWGGTTWRLVK